MSVESETDMLALQRLDDLPANFNEYVEEIAAGLSALHGPAAAAEYRRKAPQAIKQALLNPAVDGITLVERGRAAGMLLAVFRGEAGHISFIHVLQEYAHHGIAGRLVGEAVKTLRAGGVEAIVSEFVPLGEFELGSAFENLGFEIIPRLLMTKDLAGVACERTRQSRPCAPRRFPEAAEVIVDAYEGHPERRLHLDVRTPESALAFIKASSAGSYGPSKRAYVRAIWRGNRIAGAIIGCRAVPGLGFVLQVAVRKQFQGQGIGASMLDELAQEFAKAGLERMGLGVTVANPAKALYERLGFTPLRHVDAYVWWRPTSGP